MLYRNRILIARWALWGLLLVAALVLQGSVSNRLPLMGVSPLLMPVAVACVAMMGSAESGAIVGLVGGLLAYLGGDALGFVIPLLALAGALAGGLCTSFFARSLLPSLLLSLIALVLCELPTWLLRLYLGSIPVRSAITVLLPELLYSLLYGIPFYWLAHRVNQLGRP